MTKDEKIASLSTAIVTSKRADDSEYKHFSDNAPEELRDIFLENFEIRDLDYEIFDDAIDVVNELFRNQPNITKDSAEIEIYEDYSEHASVYTSDRLAYLNIWNEYEISELMDETSIKSIADACAYWYDKQVETASILINDWIHAD